MNFFKYQNFPSSRQAVDVPTQIFEWQNTDPRQLLQNIYSRSSDELWIESWLQQNNVYQPIPKIKHIEKSINHISIHDAQTSLKDCLVLLEKLTNAQQELERNVETMSSANWKQKTIEIGLLKDEFTKLMCKFECPDVIKYLKLSVERRKRKRRNQKKRKELRRTNKNLEYESRQKMHKDIDQWLRGRKEEAEKLKMEENMKKDADCVLAEVTKKKSEARKQLSLVSGLVKLRSIRENVAMQRGEKTSLEDRQAFNITTEKLVKMWESSMKTYTIEEQGLKLMLEKNASEDSKAARLAQERELVEQWHNVFFGPKHLIPQDNPTYWALTAAERDMETFVAIRKSWDTFLVPHTNEMGSKIPVGWVLPDQNSSENWCRYLEQ